VTRLDNRPEGGGVFRIAIMQKIATVSKGAASFHGRVPGHLLHPLLVWVIGDPGNVNPAALEMDEEENVIGHQAPPREDLHREEVRACQQREVSSKEFCPGCRPLALRLRRRRYAVTT
jgi:hypothetical protein